MRRPAAELRRLAECVEIRSSTSVSVAGEVIEFGDTQAEEHAFEEFLSAALYRRFYCRPSRSTVPGPPDPRAVRVFVEALSSANAGSGCWDAGWIVESKEADGALQLRKLGQQLRFSASETDFRADGGEVVPGATGRLRIGKELREMLPGFYMVLGVADRPYRSPARPRAMTRFYWHLTAQAAAPWIAELTRRFNAATVPFEAKVLSDPATYWRADAGVLYVDDAWREEAFALLPDLHQAVSARLRGTTPMFTRRLARGLAMAEDPGDGRSFGQHRCQLVAQALQQAHRDGSDTPRARLRAVVQGFARNGIDPARPWLNPGSAEEFDWPTTRHTCP